MPIMPTITAITTIIMTTSRTSMTDYVRDPAEITRLSFAAIRREADLSRLPADIEPMALRMIHACGMVDLPGDLAFSPGAGEAGRDALAKGAPILADVAMVAQGIAARRLPAGNEVCCMLGAEGVVARAREAGITRSAAAVELWPPLLAGAIVTIGNAPTALFRLLELLAEGAARPALVIATPPGFIGAAESKEALIANDLGLSYLVLKGRRGGSALAAAAVNGLAIAEDMA
jgi:precorrin-8X/cobalt-precorrin-8 methylmutase